MGTVRDALASGVRRQVETVRGVATYPKGPFTTLDQMVVNTRTTIKSVVGALGAAPPLRGLRGFRLRR